MVHVEVLLFHGVDLFKFNNILSHGVRYAHVTNHFLMVDRLWGWIVTCGLLS